MEATAPDRDRRIGAPTRALLREPLLWAAAAALVGAAVGLVGTFHLAAWVSDPNGTMRSSSPLPWLAAPFGRMLVALSLLGVPALVAGSPRQVVPGKVVEAAKVQRRELPAAETKAALVSEMAAEVLRTRGRVATVDTRLEELMAAKPEAAVVRSMPGMGPLFTAEFLSEVGDSYPFRSQLAKVEL